jgi:hypothetical protein
MLTTVSSDLQLEGVHRSESGSVCRSEYLDPNINVPDLELRLLNTLNSALSSGFGTMVAIYPQFCA